MMQSYRLLCTLSLAICAWALVYSFVHGDDFIVVAVFGSGLLVAFLYPPALVRFNELSRRTPFDKDLSRGERFRAFYLSSLELSYPALVSAFPIVRFAYLAIYRDGIFNLVYFGMLFFFTLGIMIVVRVVKQ